MGKKAIRQRMLHQRLQLSTRDWELRSCAVQQRLVAADCFSSCRTLALYNPIKNEVATDLLLQAAHVAGKKVCYPRVAGERLDFVEVGESDFQVGAFGVAEPKGRELVAINDIDLLVVPGVAFDRSGFRLGYGKGFYDRELATIAGAIVVVGLCFDFQLCPPLPVESHDQRLDYIVTETGLIPCRNEAAG
ncbi:5-formyltetrahydrofolate cyclo-ligase [Malonomonas rubra DSM 5091]|uniref:5-formyltetrahydrofolate cyclo-ligase n=1 Tax=Malonomonas rubra DSM 5091 TaxID=1122189 RepID=A0A1M6MWI5_MALRU|nr:5-formyltetrahydrofolate cyclo-ligase [Malonomonas rubra]SHJ87858.1 5-formyltetrahydrofolate cyclo-ligase [Malonomonas rubra DSM 5091]